jgi:NitT/TauT family transport system substrate-binding protein
VKALCLCSAAAFLLVGCSPGVGDREIRIGINAWPGYEIITLADQKGFFAQQGLRVKLVEFDSLADAGRSYRLGQIDGLATTMVEVLMIRDDSERDLRVARVFDVSEGADVIIAPRGIASMAGLRGLPVGVELQSLGTFMLGRALELNGMTLTDVIPVSSDQASMEEILRDGDLSAVVTYPPVALKLLEDPAFHVILSSAEIPGEVVDVLALDASLLQGDPPAAEAINRAVDTAWDYFQAHPEESIAIMAAREGISPEEFAETLSGGIRLLTPAESAAFLGPEGQLPAVAESTAEYLRLMKVIGNKPGLLECGP